MPSPPSRRALLRAVDDANLAIRVFWAGIPAERPPTTEEWAVHAVLQDAWGTAVAARDAARERATAGRSEPDPARPHRPSAPVPGQRTAVRPCPVS